MKKPNKSGFIAYYRVSTDKQGKTGLGMEAQKTAVERYLAGVTGVVLAEYTEVESGKAHRNRPQLIAALAEAKRRKATLIIAKLDRLARNVHFISGLMESGVDFTACDMPAANKLTIHIMAAMAEHEREMISARTKAALEQCKARGVQLGNPRWQEALQKANIAKGPAGIVGDEVRSLIQERRKRGESLRAIAASMNELGIKRPSGAQWYASSVNAALQAA